MKPEVKQGSIVYIDFDPTKGREQKGRRPAVIVSNKDFIKYTGLALVCPVSNTNNGFPLHIPLDDRTKTTGFILCEHVKTVDLDARKAEYVEQLPDNIFAEVKDIIYGIVE